MNALLAGSVVSVLFVLLVYYQPSKNVKVGFITYPANITALYSLISFAVSGIYLSFLLTVIAAIVARRRGWVPEGSFQLGRWGWTVSIVAALYLGLMLLNVVVPTGLTSGRGLFNLDWITLVVMVVIAVIGALYFVFARPDRKLRPTCTTRSSRPGPNAPIGPRGRGGREWPREESNLRTQIRSLPLCPLSYGARPRLARGRARRGVANGTRTRDHRDHNPGLYQLSYRHREAEQG